MYKKIIVLAFLTVIIAQKNIDVSKSTTIPVIDGNVIDDPAWTDATMISDFTQKTPDEGFTVSEKTNVRIMYSDQYFYVSVVAFDEEPNRIVVSDTRRDASLNNSDSFSFIIDTFKDFLTGYLFGTNAAGIEFDAQITGGGEGGSISRRFSVCSGVIRGACK